MILRWAPRRKAELLDAIASGAVTLEAALVDYALSAEEIAEWERGRLFVTKPRKRPAGPPRSRRS